MAQCASCGNSLRDEAKFCANCGAKYDPMGDTDDQLGRGIPRPQPKARLEPELCPGCGRTLVPKMQCCWACGRTLTAACGSAVPLQPPQIPALPEDPFSSRRRLVVLGLAAVPIALTLAALIDVAVEHSRKEPDQNHSNVALDQTPRPLPQQGNGPPARRPLM